MNRRRTDLHRGVSKKRIALRLVVAVWILAYLAAMIVYRGPAPRDASAPDDTFSSARAIQVLQRLLGDEVPHPAGSPENDAVRSRLIAELESLGLTIELHKTMHNDLPLQNVIARFPYSAEAGTPLVLATHYDSSRMGPGAGDAGSAVCAFIECARILRGEKLKRPVYMLFTDGEERGLLGAHHWVAEHPLAQQKPLVLNFDARGDRGASLLYETHEGNRRLIAWCASRLPWPKSTGSAFVSVYRRLPNGTDFTEFRRGGMRGANFALIGGVQRYHTPNDTIANLDPRSVQHHGENALALARAIAADPELDFANDQDAVFFDLFGMVVLWLPIWLARVGATFSLFAFLGLAVYEKRVKSTSVALVRLVAVVAIAGAATSAVGWALKVPAVWAHSTEPSAVTWMIGIIVYLWLTAICFTLGAAVWLLPNVRGADRFRAVWLLWSALGCLGAWWFPGICYFAAVPAFVASVALVIRNEDWRAMVSAVGVALVVIPALYLLPIALRVSAAAMIGPLIVVTLSALFPLLGKEEESSALETA